MLSKMATGREVSLRRYCDPQMHTLEKSERFCWYNTYKSILVLVFYQLWPSFECVFSSSFLVFIFSIEFGFYVLFLKVIREWKIIIVIRLVAIFSIQLFLYVVKKILSSSSLSFFRSFGKSKYLWLRSIVEEFKMNLSVPWCARKSLTCLRFSSSFLANLYVRSFRRKTPEAIVFCRNIAMSLLWKFHLGCNIGNSKS